MNEALLSAFGALMLGLMSTLHPCPLATNMAAVSTILSSPGKQRSLVVVVASFALGYLISMMSLAVVINISLSSITRVSLFLQGVTSLFLGPILILAGMLTSGLIRFDRQLLFQVKKRNFSGNSILYTILLGMLLALAFCPATASLYFGILIPLSIEFDQVYLFPLLYVLGAVVPIAATGYLIKTGSERIIKGRWTKHITQVAGYLLIFVGIYISIQQLYLA